MRAALLPLLLTAICCTETTEFVQGPVGSTDSVSADVAAQPDAGIFADTTVVPADLGTQIPQGEDKVCAEVMKDSQTVKAWPFLGLSYTEKAGDKNPGTTHDFTCTQCPGGLKYLQNVTFRYFDGKHPNTIKDINGNDYKDTITFNGNMFTEHLVAVDSATGKVEDATTTGYFFCPDPEELGTGLSAGGYYNTVWVYVDVTPAGAFGIEPGATNPCFLGYNPGDSSIGIGCNVLWDPKGTNQTEDEYCIIGSTVLGKTCTDPHQDQ